MLNFDDLCAIMRYFDANKPNDRRGTKLSLIYGEAVGRDDVPMEEVAELVLYLAQKDLLNVGQNLPNSKMQNGVIPVAKAHRIRVYFVTATGKDVLAAINDEKTFRSLSELERKETLPVSALVDLALALSQTYLEHRIWH